MTVRCYQARSDAAQSHGQNRQHNPDQTVMLFFMVAGFVLAILIPIMSSVIPSVSKQTGW